MYLLKSFVLANLWGVSSAVYQGFNYGATFTDNSAKQQSDFQNEFSTAQQLAGNSGFTSARLFTTVQAGTTNSPTSAIPAANDTRTTLLLGLWGSAGQDAFNNEITALKAAISQYGQDFADLVVAISVGSEDLYRNSATGISSNAGIGANPADITNYISQTRAAIAGTVLANKPVGHVDTWTAWVNGSNSAVTDASDFIGMDAYPYFQNTMANSITDAENLFFEAYNNTVAASAGKPVWVTETGWPVSGPDSNLALANVQNATTYFSEVGCRLFGNINTWWYILQDAAPTTPSPSFGIVGASLSQAPAYDLSCSNGGSSSASSSATARSATSSTNAGSSAEAPASSPSPPESSGPAPSQSAMSDPASSQPAPASPTTAADACQTALTNPFEYPHLIIPVDSANPDTAYGTQFNGHFSPTISSLFNFDIPSTYTNKTCTVVFLLPAANSGASFTLSGEGGITVSSLQSPATQQTTYNSVPGSAGTVGAIDSVTPGNGYVVTSGECPAGQTIGYEVSATATLDLEYFQNFAEPAIGLYVNVC
ncbi:MAG: hypothetical protein Q9160_000948 [Pyrenula sp. 1 TL-2023]